MRVSFHQSQIQIKSPMEPPLWSEKVPRWYQLDGPAFALTQLFFEAQMPFDYLVLACPGASNPTDLDFVQSGASRAQKFVHTLPNIRASMALQVVDQVCRFTCLQNGSQTIFSGLDEFRQLCHEDFTGAFATVYPINIDENSQKLQTYIAILISKNPEGKWRILESPQAAFDTSDESCINQLSQSSNQYVLGSLKLEKEIG